MAALGELPSKKGSVSVKGRVSYASQEPWVFNGSLKYNITFGQEFDEAKYWKVIHVCALQRVSIHAPFRLAVAQFESVN